MTYRDICGGFDPIQCSNMLLAAAETGGDLPPLPPAIEQAIQGNQGGRAAILLEDMRSLTVAQTAQPATAPVAAPRSDAGLGGFPVPFALIAFGGLAYFAIKSAVERFHGTDDDDDAELDAWERQLGGFEPTAALPSQPPAVPAYSVPATPRAVAPIELPDIASRGFDWGSLNDGDKHPHLFILGKTGAGKTTLARRLLAHRGGAALAITPHVKPGEWGQVPVKGAGRNYAEIGNAIAGVAAEMTRRYELYSQGVESYPEWTVVLDEVPAIMANCTEASTHLKALAREARKVKIRLIVLSQGAEVKALGIEGEGSVRESFTWVLMRGFIESLPRAVREEASVYSWPCVVDGRPADVDALPDLDAAPLVSGGEMEDFRPVSEPAPEKVREKLEAMFHGGFHVSGLPEKGPETLFYGPDALTAEQCRRQCQQLRESGKGITKTVQLIWGVAPGGTDAWKSARAEYKALMGE